MKSKNLIISFVWTFMLATVLILSWEGFGMTFVGYLILFFIALVSTVTVEILIPEKKHPGSEVLSELQNIKSKLNKLTAESESRS